VAGSLNKVMLVGNLVRDPEVRYGPDGGKIVSFSVATSEQWRDKATGERKEKAEFHRVVVFNEKIADIVEKFLKKGRKVFLEGQLQTRKWTDQSGQEKYITEVVLQRYRGEVLLLDGRGSDDQGSLEESSFGAIPFDASTPKGGGGSSLADFDDEIPF
jgi:single-strand DNA-binding protein